MKAGNKVMNAGYALAQGGYWMGLYVVMSCAAVFMQGRGYTNSQLGVVISAGSAAAFALSPMLGGIVDRSKKLGTSGMLWILLALQLLLILSFRAFPGRSMIVSICYGLYIAVNTCLVPLITQLCFDLDSMGYDIDFGAARGVGSLAYAAAAAVLGRLVERHSSELLIEAGIVLTVFQMAVLLFLGSKSRASKGPSPTRGSCEESSGMLRFIGENRRFCVLMLGVALLFFTHHLIDNFLINIVRSVGGGTKDMGNICAYMAVMELPVMFLYARISRRIGCPRCVRIGAVFFALKALGIALSSSLTGLFAAHTLQAVSYAMLTPALVEYVDRYVPHKDSARGQAVSYAMTTLGGIFSSLLGGMMFDSMSVRATLLVGALVAAAGMGVCLLAAEKS